MSKMGVSTCAYYRICKKKIENCAFQCDYHIVLLLLLLLVVVVVVVVIYITSVDEEKGSFDMRLLQRFPWLCV